MRKPLIVGASFFFLLLTLLPSARAQNAISGGSISGQVTDASGAAVPAAMVTATNTSTGVEAKTKTNASGFYNFSSLSVGAYNVSVSQAGFNTTVINNVLVQVGQNTAENVSLQVGEVTQSVTVTAQAPLLRTTESTVSTVVNENLISNLPLSGRRYTDFVLLTPNANADGQFGLVSMGGQQGGGDSGYANGNGANSFTVDGANATSNYFGDARGRTRVPYVFGEQSIQEFQVSDNPYNAAYGGAGAGFVNTVTKSGTDTLHGDAFYYNRNSGVGNANDAIDKANGLRRPVDVLQQFGADLGGPLFFGTSPDSSRVSNKVWYYFDYEEQRRKEPISVINTAYSGINTTFFDDSNGNPLPSGTILPAPNSSYPAPLSFNTPPASSSPNYPAYLQQVSNAIGAVRRNLGQRARRADNVSFFPKIDWQPTSDDHVTLVYNYSRFNSPGGEITFNPVATFGDESLPNNFVRDHHASAHWAHTFSSAFLNDVHLSFLRDEQLESPSGLTSPTLGQIEFFSPSFFELGNPTFSVGDNREAQWQFNDQITYVKGRHTLNFGFDFDHTNVTDFFPGNFNGTYAFSSISEPQGGSLPPINFNSFTAFALGEYVLFSQAGGNPTFPFTYPYYGFYAQDKFQMSSKLTLDFGLREDFQVYQQPTANTTTGDPLVAKLTGQFPNQYNRFSPRLGFAYQAFPKTVVRGGFGLFREILDGINYESSVISNGLPSRQATTSVFCFRFASCPVPDSRTPTFPNVFSSTSSFSGSFNLSIVDPGFKIPYIIESSLEIQQEILPSTTLTAGTMWTHGVHLLASSAYDKNLIPPTGTTTYNVCSQGFAPATKTSPEGCVGSVLATLTRPNLDSGLLTDGLITPAVGQINALISPGVNNYNAFYLQLQRRAARGLSVMTSYTFSKNMQTGVDFFNQFDLKDTHGPSLLDQRHRLSIAAVYAPNASGLATLWERRALSDWTISTVMQFNSGRPYSGLLTSASGGSTINDSAANESTGNTAAGIAGAGPSPVVGLDAFYGPWINEIDMGLTRRFHITERQTIQLEAQVFNLFNHPNFYVQNGSGINQNQYDPNGATCGDGATLSQTCFLAPDPGFKTLQSIGQLNGPRTFQFAFRYQF
ncbi:MAG TPA: TonB-dependent receptor [Candidatus Acidoferrales bacterium]|nr:TonB-dependent receptor [Candidatus Acidoferrales bacterium]